MEKLVSRFERRAFLLTSNYHLLKLQVQKRKKEDGKHEYYS